MKLLLSFLPALLADRALNGWQIDCRVDSGLSDETGPAFMDSNRLNGKQLNLYWSTFGRGYGAVVGSGPFGVPNDDNFCASTSNSTTTLVQDDAITWPNEVGEVPLSVFGQGYMHIPNGFAVPYAHDGCIAIANLNSGYPVDINNMQIITGGCGFGRIGYTKYYYHVAKWFDMDGDGDLDLLTARGSSFADPTNPSESDLVWFQNPGTGFQAGNNNWKNYVITGAQNVADIGLDVWSDGTNIYVITGGFGTKKLVLLSGSNWTRPSSVKAKVIDNDGRYFEQSFIDLDQDGILDVVATIGSYGEQPGSLVVYQGSNGKTGYTLGKKITVYDQFPMFNSKGLGSPGGVLPFWNGEDYKQQGVLPSLLISGDDDGTMYLATPDIPTVGSFDFQYTTLPIYQVNAFNPFVTPLNAPTVGKPAIVDFNEDGCYEVAVAAYYSREVVIISQNNRTCKRRN